MHQSAVQKKMNAILTQSRISVNKNDTALFINKVLLWWEILNVKTFQIDNLHNNPLQAEIRSPNDSRLNFIIEFGEIVLNMASNQGHRIKQLFKHTDATIHCTCNGTVSLC